MKRLINSFPLLLLFLPVGVYSQIVIDQNDMPNAGDTLRVSMTSNVPDNFSLTGQDMTWDFSMLEAMSQRVDTFVMASSTPPEYWLYFFPGLTFNLASPQGTSEFFPGFPLTQAFTFYKKTSDAFVDNGFAFKIQGVPVAAKYDVPDKYYAFPIDTNAAWASASSVALEFPGMFYFSTQRARTSFVDGWGTVITPFGSFESIRVRSDLVQHDSIFIESMAFGIGMDRNITEFKWMAETMGIPVLQVNSEGLLTTATYRDTPRLPSLPLNVSLGPDTTVTKGAMITLHASVAGGALPYRYIWSTMDTTQSITVLMDSTSSFGVVVVDGLNTFASDQKLITVVSPGIEEQQVRQLNIFPNPVIGKTHISTPADFQSGILVLTDWSGQEILRKELHKSSEPLVLDLAHLSAGLYVIRLVTDGKLYMGKIVRK